MKKVTKAVILPVWSTAYTLKRPPAASTSGRKRTPPSSVRSMRTKLRCAVVACATPSCSA